MRPIPEALAARLASGTARLCHVWLLKRRDGLRLGFTDHDEPLTMDGVACGPSSAWSAGASGGELSTQPGSGVATGALDDDAVRAGDLDAGLFDGAEVELRRVDWERPELWLTLSVGRVARVSRTGERFEAEIEGPLAALDRVAGRTYGRRCDAALGDTRCRVDVDDPEFAGAECDKRFATCREVFRNTGNFRGFPDIPGEDFLMLTPAEGGRHDGGSRR